MTTLLEIEGLSRRFGSLTAVDGVSFSVARGEVLGFLGPNGAGKSTSMKMITGFLPPTSGTARVCGHDVVDAPIEVKKRIGYLPEGAPLYGDMTPQGLLAFIAAVRGMEGRERKRASERVVDRLQLASVLTQPIDTLSKGFKRRVGLAAALLHDPEVLILDEPTDGLDPNQKHEVRRLLSEVAPEKAIIVSTHILEEVDAICSRAILIAGGRVVADSTPEALLARSPHHNAVSVRIAQEHVRTAEAALNALDRVAGLERADDGDWARITVLPMDGAEILDPVRRRLEEVGAPPSEIAVERGRLDEVFRELTRP